MWNYSLMTVFIEQKDINIFREAGRRLASVLRLVIAKIKPGVTELELDSYARCIIEEEGDVPAFLNYRPDGAVKPYPATLCISVNNQVVHGIPSDYALQSGDIVAIDIGLIHNGMVSDMARTIAVGEVDEDARRLISVTENALMLGIKAARAGGRIGDIGAAVESFVEQEKFSIVSELGGHGIGHDLHEKPFVSNVGRAGSGAKLREGQALAIEPIVNEGEAGIQLSKDGYTVTTLDGKRSAHFEDTILVTVNGPEIITKP